MTHRLTRRWLVSLGGVAVAATVTACTGTTTGPSEVAGEFDWKRFDGESVSIYIADTGQAEFLTERIPEFEELTGIEVELETSDVTSYRQNLPVRLTARSSDFDVMATDLNVDKLQFEKNGWYAPLTPYIENESLTSPDWDFEDFPAGVRAAMTSDEEIVNVLWEMQTDLVYYRKDFLEQTGLDVPTTFQEWADAAAAVHDPSAGVYGFALRGLPYQTTSPFSSFLYAYCGAWSDGNTMTINTPEALEAYEMYGSLGHKYGPPGIEGFDWPIPAQQFGQGVVFAFLDVTNFVSDLEDPSKSVVAGNIGYAPVPEGPCGRKPFIGGQGYALNPFSAQPEIGWYFIQWATSPEMNLEMKLTGWPSPRASAWVDEGFLEADPAPQFSEVVLESVESADGVVMAPPVIPPVQAREIAGLVANEALRGATGSQLSAIADRQNAELQKLADAQ